MLENRLNSLLSAWQEEQLQGRDRPATELCRDCPELAEGLNRRMAVLPQMNELLQPGGLPARPDAVGGGPATGNGQTDTAGDGIGEAASRLRASRPDSAPLPG